MVIEHVFITTLDAPQTLKLASDFLTARGFTAANQGAFQIGEWTTLEMTRGRNKPQQAKSVEELPQRLRLQWDRGRVTVAASISPFHRTSFSFSSGEDLPANSPKMRLHLELLMAIAEGLEQLLAQRRPPDEAQARWNNVAAAIADDARRRKRRGRMTLTIFLVFIGLLVALAILANTL